MLPREWCELQCSGEIPEGRVGHSLTTSADGNSLLLYGGSVEVQRSHQSAYFDDLFSLDPAARVWRKIHLHGAVPVGRGFHSAVIGQGDGLMWIFGGCNAMGRFSDVHSINPVTGECRQAATPASPPARYCHTAVSYEGRMYVHGGKYGTRSTVALRYDDLCRFSFESGTWETCQQLGTIPPSRSAHSAFVCGRTMVILGGRSAKNECCDDLYQFHFDTHVWRSISTINVVFSRARHCAVYHNGLITIFGGWNGLKKLNDLIVAAADTLHVQAYDDSNRNAPFRRECHVGCVWRNNLVITGGRFRSSFLNETHMLVLGAKTLRQFCREWIIDNNVQPHDAEDHLPPLVSRFVYAWRAIQSVQMIEAPITLDEDDDDVRAQSPPGQSDYGGSPTHNEGQ